MRHILITAALSFALSACGTEADMQKSVYGYSQGEVQNQTRICKLQVITASQNGETDRWSKWAQCHKEKAMPIDMEAFDLSREEIEPVYDSRISRLKALETKYNQLSTQEFQQELDKIYDLYDKEKKEAGAKVCEKWTKLGDGSGSKICLKYPSIF